MSFLKQILDELVARVVSSPLQFRLILQPGMAIFLGIRDGIRDAKAGAAPFLWGVFFLPIDRRPSLLEALLRLKVPILFATLVDGIVQFLMFHHVRPLSALFMGTLLMALPYSCARGLANRFRSSRRGRGLFGSHEGTAHGRV